MGGPLFSTPSEVVRQALDADVHIIGVSSQAAGHNTLVPQLAEELKSHGVTNMLLVVGGVIPPKDYDFLYSHGVAAVFGPGTQVPVAALQVIDKLEAVLGSS